MLVEEGKLKSLLEECSLLVVCLRMVETTAREDQIVFGEARRRWLVALECQCLNED